MVPLTTADAAVRSRASGALTGLALGDSMGRPGQGLTPDQLRSQWGWVTCLLAGGSGGKAGTVGRATRSVFAVAPGRPRPGTVHEWSPPAFESRAVPIGLAFRADSVAARVAAEAAVGTRATALAGAGLVAGLVSSALDAPVGAEHPAFLAAHLEMGFRTAEEASATRAADAASSVIERCLLARDIALRAPDDAVFLRHLYDAVGATGRCTEAVPAAVGILIRADGDPVRTCVLAANLGGETCRVGALSTAMAGAVFGRDAIPAKLARRLERVNRLKLADVAEGLLQLRG